jgi:hypothetical protein
MPQCLAVVAFAAILLGPRTVRGLEGQRYEQETPQIAETCVNSVVKGEGHTVRSCIWAQAWSSGVLRLHFNDSRCRNGRSWRLSPTPRAVGWCAGSHLRARFFNRRIAVAQVGKIIQRFEEKGFTLAGLKLLRPTAELAAQYAPKQLNGRGSAAAVRTPCGRHYAEHNGRHFFPKLVRFLASGPVVAMVPLGCARCPSLSSDCLKTTMRA